MLNLILATLATTQAGIGACVPDVALHDMSGKAVRLSRFRGKKVVLFTWASW